MHADLSIIFSKGMIHGEELCLNSWEKRKNNWHTTIFCGTLLMRPELSHSTILLLFWLAQKAICWNFSKRNMNLIKIVGSHNGLVMQCQGNMDYSLFFDDLNLQLRGYIDTIFFGIGSSWKVIYFYVMC